MAVTNMYATPIYNNWATARGRMKRAAAAQTPYNAYAAPAPVAPPPTSAADFRMIDNASAVNIPAASAGNMFKPQGALSEVLAKSAATAVPVSNNMFNQPVSGQTTQAPVEIIQKPMSFDDYTQVATDPNVSDAATAGAGTGGLMDSIGGLSGIASAIGAGAQIYNAYNQGLNNSRMLREQKKINNMYIREANERRAARNQFQSNIDDVWGA